MASATLLATCALLSAAATAHGQAEPAFESPPHLRARDLVEAEILRGAHHRVIDRVQNDGAMNHFVVESDFGVFEADSERMLHVRIQEIAAIAKLREISRTKAFSDALRDAVNRPVDAVEQIVTQPVETLKAAPASVGRAARGLFYKTRKVAHKVEEAVRDRDEEPDASSEDAPDEENPDLEDRVAAAAEKEARDRLGYTRARRDLAARLQVDPYSDNEVLQRELNRLAQGAFVAGLTFRFTMPTFKPLGYVEDVNELVWTVSPTELERRNNKSLADMDVPKSVRLDLFENSAWSTTLETALVQTLEALEGVADRSPFAALAVSAVDRRDARRILVSAAILASYHATVGPLDRLEVITNAKFGELIVGRTASGRYVVPGAADYLIWQQGMAGGPLETGPDKELRLSGDLSPRARRELEQRGWQIETEALPDRAAALR